MGRRARTNCSPIDSVMEKYHNDIGNRLSGVFMPTHPTADGSEPLSEDFCMLTLDTRHLSSIKNKTRVPETIMSSENDIHSDVTEDSDMSTYPADSLASMTSYRTGGPNEQENTPKEKKSIMDKLKPVLQFKSKKHICSRCNRKSRNCQPHKNFSGTEKRYMCDQCREKLNSLNSLFVEKSSFKDCERTVYPAEQSSSSKSKNLIIPSPRTHLNDSGYETVTSCSTVASSYSAFNAPENTNSNANRDNSAVKPTQCENPGLSSRANITAPKPYDTKAKYDASLNSHCICSNQDTTSNAVVNKTAGLYQFMGPAQHGSPAGVLRQVKHKNNEDYDGYLPEFCDQGCGESETTRPALSDATNLGGAMRVINVSKPPQQAPTQKACYTCESTTKPCFRLPWLGGWICEDCLDNVH